MFTNKVSGNRKKNNSSLTETESYDHYIALDWSEKNMAIARLGKKDTEPKVIDVPSDLKELKLYLSKSEGQKDTDNRRDNNESVVICRVV